MQVRINKLRNNLLSLPGKKNERKEKPVVLSGVS